MQSIVGNAAPKLWISSSLIKQVSQQSFPILAMLDATSRELDICTGNQIG
jgi:hypothetical protein